jgi:hypothetical protein
LEAAFGKIKPLQLSKNGFNLGEAQVFLGSLIKDLFFASAAPAPGDRSDYLSMYGESLAAPSTASTNLC